MIISKLFLQVANGMYYLQGNIPAGEHTEQLEALTTYFDATYVTGTFRSVSRRTATSTAGVGKLCLRRLPALFPPENWNVFQATLDGTDRTNNHCESWNNAFSHLGGQPHPSLWVLILALRRDQAMASVVLLQHARNQPPVKRVMYSFSASFVESAATDVTAPNQFQPLYWLSATPSAFVFKTVLTYFNYLNL